MKTDKKGEKNNLNQFEKFKLNLDSAVKFESLNQEYKSLVDSIKKELGSLEDIRTRLALSRRQIAKLLMVDPSAWTRWTRDDQDAPPHIYQALKWYSQLVEKIPDIHAPLTLENKFDMLRKDADLKIQKLKSQIDQIQVAKHINTDPFSKFSNVLSENFKNLSDRLIEFQNMKGVGELEILKYTNSQLQEKTSSLEGQMKDLLLNLKKAIKLPVKVAKLKNRPVKKKTTKKFLKKLLKKKYKKPTGKSKTRASKKVKKLKSRR